MPPLARGGQLLRLCCSLPLTDGSQHRACGRSPVGRLNYGAVAKRLLKVGAEVASRHAVKRRLPDALAVKACIDALDKELRKLEKIADDFRHRVSVSTSC